MFWSLGDLNPLRRSRASHRSIRWRVVVGESEGATFAICLQSLGPSAGLQELAPSASSYLAAALTALGQGRWIP